MIGIPIHGIPTKFPVYALVGIHRSSDAIAPADLPSDPQHGVQVRPKVLYVFNSDAQPQ